MSDVSDSDTHRQEIAARVDQFPRWLIAIAVALGLGYAGFVVLLWRLGLFDVPEGGPDARIFAAVFALLGALFGAVLTFTAALLKHTIDTRTLDVSRQTEARLALENSQTDARLKLDTAIRAVELLSTADGDPSPPVKQAGSLFALTNLGQVDLALALLAQTWPADQVSSEAAMWVIDRGLRDENMAIQIDSARIYYENGTKLKPPGPGTPFIPALLWEKWPADSPLPVRQYLLDAFITALGSSDPNDYSRPDIYGILGFLDDSREQETEVELQRAMLWAMEAVALAREPTSLDDIRDKLGDEGPELSTASYYYDSLTKLRSEWESTQ